MGMFDVVIRPVDNMIRVQTAQSRTLAALGDVLLPTLVSGEARSRDAEKFIEKNT